MSHELNALLSHVVASPAREAQWLDLLSQLEYVGCRKILKSLPFDRVSLEVLHHVSEEASHAFLLRAAAERLGHRAGWGESYLGAIGWSYFQALDRGVTRIV